MIKQQPGSQEVDLEATAELPVIDFEAPADATDTFAALVMPDLSESLHEVESRLRRKGERVHELEAQLAAMDSARKELLQGFAVERSAAADAAGQASARLAAAQEELQHTRAALEQRAVELSVARESLAGQELEISGLRRSAAQQELQLAGLARDVTELRHRTERQHESLRHAAGFRGVLEAVIADRDEALATIEARHHADLAASNAQGANLLQEAAAREAELQAQLQALRESSRARIGQLEGELAQRAAEVAESRLRLQAAEARGVELAREVEELRTGLAQQQFELDSLRATAETATLGAQVFEQQKGCIHDLEGELITERARSARLEEELGATRERIERLESDARASVSLLGDLKQDMARLGRDETGSRPALKLVGSDASPERFLVSEQDGREVRRPLGRRTSIGRTPDNDLQIEASYVSRHHAVILGSARHCIIEDLNSVNGVLVNGRRITRHALCDGDSVTIGRSTFRFRQPAPKGAGESAA